MSSQTFADRFKGKSSTQTNTALFSIKPELAVTKPQENQVHAQGLESPKNLTITKSASPQGDDIVALPAIQFSKTPKHFNPGAQKAFLFGFDDISQEGRKTPGLRSQVSGSPSSPLNRSLQRGQFKPYSLKDYIKIKPTKYLNLGGLGPNIGSEEWLKKKYLKEKRMKYGQDVLKSTKEPKDLIDDDSYDHQKSALKQRFESPWKIKIKKKGF